MFFGKGEKNNVLVQSSAAIKNKFLRVSIIQEYVPETVNYKFIPFHRPLRYNYA